MSEDSDDWFRRWRRGSPFGPWPFGDIDDLMKDMEKAFAEQFREMEKEMPKGLVRESRLPDGSTRKEIGPIVYGYSVTIGPDGKPIVREFGNVKRGEGTPFKEIQDKREPLIDVVATDKEVRVIAELPGVSKDEIGVTVTDRALEISVDSASRKYYKKLDLPGVVDPNGAKSSYNNGILEVTIPLTSKGGTGVKLKVG